MINRLSLRALLLPITPVGSDLDLSSSVRSVVGGSLREALLSAALTALVVIVACALHAQVWLALFVTLLFPSAAVSLLLQVFQFFDPEHESWSRIWWVLLIGLLLFCGLAWVAYQYWNTQIGSRGLNALQFFSGAIAFGLLNLGAPLWSAQGRVRAVQVAELKRAAMAAQLKALQAQVEPHFLYNVLANARYLTRQDPPRATQMLDHLIAYLRSALPDMRSSVSTLGREFELAGHYLELMAMRFGQRLQFRLDIADALRPLPMPPLMLMTLVENAVRHGVEPSPGNVQIEISATTTESHLQLRVCDDGAGLQDKVLGSGVGLRNLRERLGAMYGQQASFTLQTLQNGAIEATLSLPLANSNL